MSYEGEGKIYSATYSNVPVYELKIAGDHVMRRRSDDWINATHILKLAGFDKPARTRILEREVQKGVHEKIQGGYGKYQGTWVPLHDGRSLAGKNGVLARLRKIFDFVSGEESPPPAPKHATAAPSRPKGPRASQSRKPSSHIMNQSKEAKKHSPHLAAGYYRASQEQYDQMSSQLHDDETPGNMTPETTSFMAEEETLPMSQTSTMSRKRKRATEGMIFSELDAEHITYGDELLDYFVTSAENPSTARLKAPTAPASFPIDKAIDNQGNNSLHWACAMGDIQVARDLVARGAHVIVQNEFSGETPLIRAVLFTNNYDRQTFPKIVNLLSSTILERDWHGANVFHHIAETGRFRNRWGCARHYSEVLVNKLRELGPQYLQAALTASDENQDTPVQCAVRNGCTKVALFLINHCPEAGDIPNLQGQTANELLRNMSHGEQSLEQTDSSPTQTEPKSGRGRSKYSSKVAASRTTAAQSLVQIFPILETATEKLACAWDAEMEEKETSLIEGRQALSDLESQKQQICQQSFALKAQAESGDQDNTGIHTLRQQYDTLLGINESLLEQQDHSALQQQVRAQDEQTPAAAFRNGATNNVLASSTSTSLTTEEIQSALPWARELHRQQMRRRDHIRNIARLMSDVGTSERIGKHRKLVAMATGLKEDELDAMSAELLESLETANQGHGVGPSLGKGSIETPITPVRVGQVAG